MQFFRLKRRWQQQQQTQSIKATLAACIYPHTLQRNTQNNWQCMKKLASWWMAHTNTASSKGSCILDRSRVCCLYSLLQENGGAGLSQCSSTLCVCLYFLSEQCCCCCCCCCCRRVSFLWVTFMTSVRFVPEGDVAVVVVQYSTSQQQI